MKKDIITREIVADDGEAFFFSSRDESLIPYGAIRSSDTYKPFERLIPTPDNWFPTINGKVEATVCRDDSTTVRVSVWGGDDIGLERVWKFLGNWEAEEFFHRKIEEVSKWKSITKASLISDGFITA